MIDVLCAGFACMDFSLTVPRHPAADEKLRAGSLGITGGGPAANAAVQVARLGGRTAFAGCVGHDLSGEQLRRAFADEGVGTSALVATLPQTPLAVILVKPDGRRSVVSHRETGACPEPPFPPARVVLIDGHRPEWTAGLAAHARACPAPLVLDAGSLNDATRDAARVADHVVASEAFACAALDGAPPDEAGLEKLAARLSRPDATWVVTLGARGLVWRHEGKAGRLPAFRVRVADTNGAGDAFHGGYAFALACGLPFVEMLRFASATAALACTRPGGWPSLPRAEEVERCLREYPM
ncbi:sugar kinase, ribokinase [Opitutaceae bacterium TAV1]|nr:sugar kinase, ribokinase [Opitutaceae bacterium TAV1]